MPTMKNMSKPRSASTDMTRWVKVETRAAEISGCPAVCPDPPAVLVSIPGL